jgi:hypothetical protein
MTTDRFIGSKCLLDLYDNLRYHFPDLDNGADRVPLLKMNGSRSSKVGRCRFASLEVAGIHFTGKDLAVADLDVADLQVRGSNKGY